MISIIIPNLNGEKFLKDCINSIINQEIDEKFEIIIVDNGSKDKSEDIIKKGYPEINFIKLDKNYGFAKAVNIGIKNSNGEYIVLLNNDIVLDKNFLKNLKKGLDDNPEVDFCASRILMINDKNLIYGAGDIYKNNGTAELRGYGKPKNLYEKSEFVFGACAAASIYRRELFEKIGLFDEDFFAYYEDVDLDWRAQLFGFKCLYVPEAIVYHYGSSTFGNFSDFKIYYGTRNILLVLFKDVPDFFVKKYFLNILFIQIGRLIFFTLRGKLLPVIRALIDAFKMKKLMKEKRKEIYNNIKVSDKYVESIITKISLNNYFEKFKLKLKEK